MRTFAVLLALTCSLAAHAFGPSFHANFDGTLTAAPGGAPAKISGEASYVGGKVGEAAVFNAGTLATYPAKGFLDKSQGAVSFWLRPNWDGDDGQSHGLLAEVSNFNDKLKNTLYLWKWSTGQLRLDLRCPADPYLTYDVRHWKAGEWHHVGASWDALKGLALFVDGECVARRDSVYDVVPATQFNLGGDWAGNANGDAAFDDVRLYPVALQGTHFAALMKGEKLEEAAVTNIVAPKRVVVGQPFAVQVEASAPTALAREYPIVVRLDGIEIGSGIASPKCRLWAAGKKVDLAAIEVTIPSYLRVLPGMRRLTAELGGAVQSAKAAPVSAAVNVSSPVAREGHTYSITEAGLPLRDGAPFPSSGPAEGFLYDGVFYGNDETGRARAVELIRSGLIQDALPCRLIDAVDCTTQDHGFVGYGQSEVRELAPGRTFRVTGAPDSAEQNVKAYGQERPALPGFAYTLANVALPVPHVLVAEFANDRERYTDVAIDAATGSQLAPHLHSSGPGETRLIDLATVYSGGEYACDGLPFRRSFVFYPKSNACEVTVTGSARDISKGAECSAAVSRLWVYQLLDEQGGLYNEVPVPHKEPQRSVSLFFPEHRYLYSQWGFSGVGNEQRRASLLSFFDYMKFMGLNRVEFHPVGFGMSCYYNGGRLPNAGTYDVFDDILPLAQERGIEVVPALDGLAFYDKSPEFTRDSFQLDKDGVTVRNVFGDVPDPLRPEVQQRLLTFLGEFSDRARGYNCVPFIAFKVDGKMGTCYSGDARNRPPEDAGYSEWDIQQFEKATGKTVGGTAGDTPSRYAALRSNPELWQEWLSWRCEGNRELWLKARDLVASRGDRRLLVKTILPSNFPGRDNLWQEQGLTPLDVLRNHGVDPRPFAQEKGLRMTRAMMVGADRYFGEEANKSFFYSDHLAPLYETAEGSETELYSVYWELPWHPKGFRVGAASGPGRAFFEPLTYTLRVNNPYNLTFYNWYPGTIGHEIELRRFIRSYRGLPAVAAKEFEGEVMPRDPKLVARWFGNKLAIINDSPKARTVRLTFPRVLSFGTRITNLGTGQELAKFAGKTKTRVEVELEGWDLVTLEVKEPRDSNILGK